MIGKVLANRYRIGERIGGGGMALVYRAEDLQLGRDVAVKVLRGQFGSDEEFIRRFRREAQNAASLSHPNVVQIYDVGQDEDQYYIVMELVEGHTLKELIQQQGPLPPTDAARIAIEILGALSHAHQNRIVHRDIKPHNILISRDGRVKVTDFGIARATTTDTVTHTGSIMGSAHYFSPEQANGLATGDRSDIYSVGIVLYEMITGVVPFQGESPITVALKHIRDMPLSPSQRNDEVPAELEHIIMRALEKDPERRYGSAQGMRNALEKFLEDHAAGLTHIVSGNFPTMDFKGMKAGHNARRLIDEEEGFDEGAVAPDRPPRRSRAWIWILAVALAVVAGLGAAVWGAVGFLQVPEVNVPSIEGLPLLQAQNELTNAGLSWRVQTDGQYSLTVPAQAVIRSEPPPGTPVKKGRRIDIVLSKGRETKQLADVRNRSIEEARAMLESDKFKLEVTQQHAQVKEGTVIEQAPLPLTPVDVGSTVSLVVSSGPLRVPSVVGKDVEEARRLISVAGLTPGTVQATPNPSKPKDTVLASDPPADTPVAPGQTVNLTVSQGPAVPAVPAVPEGKPFEKVIIVPGAPGKPHDVRVTLVDTVGGVPNEQPPL
ncbi:MAG: serine/threonine protein kinase, partial [Firmicutes bacterium]|nr:serine/threonine protein kinase [Bacillota bacterium]